MLLEDFEQRHLVLELLQHFLSLILVVIVSLDQLVELLEHFLRLVVDYHLVGHFHLEQQSYLELSNNY